MRVETNRDPSTKFDALVITYQIRSMDYMLVLVFKPYQLPFAEWSGSDRKI